MKDLTPDDLDEISILIKQFRNDAIQEKVMLTMIDHRMKLAIAHPSKIEELELWKKENQILGLHGPNLDFNDTERIVDGKKIETKIKQLPHDTPGLVYFPVSLIYFLTMKLPESILAFQNVLKNYPNVLGLTLFTTGALEFDEKLMSFASIIYNTKKVDGVNRCLLHIPNPAFVLDFHQEAYKALQQSYIS